jgi:hypothetical protein
VREWAVAWAVAQAAFAGRVFGPVASALKPTGAEQLEDKPGPAEQECARAPSSRRPPQNEEVTNPSYSLE